MTEIAVLGGGCFWCTESVFGSLRGVLEVTPGYAGGHVDHPTYEQVCRQSTGHIEVVNVVFDPETIDFKTLLQVFFATHDPLTLDRQGADVGPQYASAIFCQSNQQKEAAQQVIDDVQKELGAPVVTRLFGAEHFWPAESYHHNYYEQHPAQGYCQVVISPKLAKLRRHFGALLQR
ncbi:MAG TPA: peptide-methionine (S)-S-oxide reductase MsrA [Candidimonas sp.]|nr:peptide-methionine (S)-S-oxide reductase MsrA [Candidimonas sp.]